MGHFCEALKSKVCETGQACITFLNFLGKVKGKTNGENSKLLVMVVSYNPCIQTISWHPKLCIRSISCLPNICTRSVSGHQNLRSLFPGTQIWVVPSNGLSTQIWVPRNGADTGIFFPLIILLFKRKRNIFWSERSVCDQRSNLGRPLFFGIFLSSLFSQPITKIPEGVVIKILKFSIGS